MQKKVARLQATAKYEKKIQELGELLERKTDECYQSWMSYTAANQQLEKVRMDLDNKTFDTYSLGKGYEYKTYTIFFFQVSLVGTRIIFDSEIQFRASLVDLDSIIRNLYASI